MKKEVINIFKENEFGCRDLDGVWINGVYDKHFDMVADEVVKLFAIHNVSKSIATEYAEFCVRCDREKLPLLCLGDYIKQYCY